MCRRLHRLSCRVLHPSAAPSVAPSLASSAMQPAANTATPSLMPPAVCRLPCHPLHRRLRRPLRRSALEEAPLPLAPRGAELGVLMCAAQADYIPTYIPLVSGIWNQVILAACGWRRFRSLGCPFSSMGDGSGTARSRRISFSAAGPAVVVTRADSASSEMPPELAAAATEAYGGAPGGGDGKVPMGELEGLLSGLAISGGVSDFLQRQKVVPKSQETISQQEFVSLAGALQEFVQYAKSGEPSSSSGPPGASKIAPALLEKLTVCARRAGQVGRGALLMAARRLGEGAVASAMLCAPSLCRPRVRVAADLLQESRRRRRQQHNAGRGDQVLGQEFCQGERDRDVQRGRLGRRRCARPPARSVCVDSPGRVIWMELTRDGGDWTSGRLTC